MQAQHPSSSKSKAITSPSRSFTPFRPARPLLATAVIGAALIAYLVHKTTDARQRLEVLTDMALALGDLSVDDAAVVNELLARPATSIHTQGQLNYVF